MGQTKCEYLVSPTKKCGRGAMWRMVVGRGMNLCGVHVVSARKFGLMVRPIRPVK